MPVYSFENTKTGKEFDKIMSISEKEEYLNTNTHIKQVLNRINIVGGVSGMSYRQDQGWKENLSRIAEKHPTSALAREMGTRTTKQIKTEQVIKKHRARQNAKNK
jgi:predicted nucleic acid-binding Zn ribbon protein